ncbi:Sushi, nidogen and EGF-like domain-containing protein 1, partial [Lamellibrachia satsuma]
DTTANDGRVYYRNTTDAELLQRATDDVRSAFDALSQFTASWLFIATWHNVTCDGGSYDTPVNTFQVVMISNGHMSFVIMNYGDINY